MATVRIPLASRKYPNLFAVVDEEDLELVKGYRWRPSVHPRKSNTLMYALSRQPTSDGSERGVFMHRIILGLDPDDPAVDHIDGDGLNNSRSNLRLCTSSQNSANRRRLPGGASSRYRGVTLHRKTGKWQAAIGVERQRIYLGLFDSERDAALAYNDAAVRHFGEFANINEGLT